ncbi:apolipoprotein N-acyltransferase [Celeribacter sp. PS-C1]|uniref:apolipoprotein N-acyltransferase n=1 Tax=Celeribacter sp. PS-C1 TaxID=2820813 RepID=UPI001CA56E0A|nr:apolipoprotein N-acyltransferase [Celeribacter sp. PS-C1]MBW6418625.1 apolipoprotein N-acyltransferase [Celeribacter sp. PS-C1]
MTQRRPRLRRLITPPRAFALSGGVLIAAGQAPLGFWPVALIGLTMAAISWRMALTPGQAALRGWLVGLSTFLISLSWIVNPFLVEPWRHGWMIPFALFLMAGGLALFWALAFYLAKRLKTGLPGLAAFWGLMELARGHVFTGFPWAMPGYIWLDTPIAQLSAFIGPYALTALSFAYAALLAHAVLARSRKMAVLAVVCFIATWIGGAYRLSQPMPPNAAHNIRVVQPNAPQHLKWDPDYIPVFYNRALDLTAPDASEAPADLVIWPETSVAAPLYAAGPYLREIAEVAAPARAIVGLNRVDGMQGYNSAIHLDEAGQVIESYDKHHLVPFGEYMPLPWLLERIGLRAFTAKNGYGYSAGPGPQLFDAGALGQALPLICYEAIFPRDLRTETRPDWLLQMTNDAWFGTFSGPQQALAQARFRAIETGLPMVRGANTGVSALINARGEVLAQIPLGTSGAFTAPLPGKLSETPYLRLKEGPVWALLTLLVIAGWARTRMGSARKTD